MNDTDQLKGTPFEQNSNNKRTPGSLKTLAILTFVGSALILFFSGLQQLSGKKNLELMEKMQGSEEIEKLPAFFQQFYTPEAIEIARITYENRVPLLIISLVSLTLCIYGAILMLFLKKLGYFFWVIGNILPLIGTLIFVGPMAFKNVVSVFILIIFALFFILYTRHLKYLK